MQVHASHRIALNESRLKILLSSRKLEYKLLRNFAYLLRAVCYCLHLIIPLWVKSYTSLFYSELKRHSLCTVPHVIYVSLPEMSYMYLCPRYNYDQLSSTEVVTLRRSVQGTVTKADSEVPKSSPNLS